MDGTARDTEGMRGLASSLDELIEPHAAAARQALASAERDARGAVALGRLVAVGVLICLVTGIYSHLLQEPLPGLALPTRPVEIYQWTQGTHVIVGTALLPLVLAKLWVVYPRLFEWPPIRSWGHLLERLSIAVLVSAMLVQIVTGILNTFQWYPWPFSFRTVHFALSFVIVGTLVLHVAVKLPLIVRHWRRERAAS